MRSAGYMLLGLLAALFAPLLRRLRGRTTDASERKRAEDIAHALTEVAHEIAGPLTMPAVAERIVAVVLRTLRAHRAALFEVDAVSGDLACLATAGRVDREQMVGRVIGADVGVVGRALSTGRPVWFPEVSTLDPRFGYPEWARRVLGDGAHSSMAAPLTVKRETIGALGFAAEAGRQATTEELDLLSALAHQAAVALQNARFYRDVQETERRNLARELHDEIGQLLTGLTLILERSKHLPSPASLACVNEAQALAAELLSKVRNLSLDLRPAMLDDLGLLPALLWHFERYTASTGVKVVFSQHGLEGRRFAADVETATYRIVQEALTNVARHSGAYEARVTVAAAAGLLSLEVQDQGAGFDVDAVFRDERTSGLIGLRERARLSSGRLTLTSVRGAGTRLTAELPAALPRER
jgi:signal transduction histidine kinase